MFFRHNRAVAHSNSQQFVTTCTIPGKAQAVQKLGMKGGGGHEVPSLAEELFVSGNYQKRVS